MAAIWFVNGPEAAVHSKIVMVTLQFVFDALYTVKTNALKKKTVL